MPEGNDLGLSVTSAANVMKSSDTTAQQERITIGSFETESKLRVKAIESQADANWQYLQFLVFQSVYGTAGVESQSVTINLKEEAASIKNGIASPLEADLFQNIISKSESIYGNLVITNIFDGRSGLSLVIPSQNVSIEINLRAVDYLWYQKNMIKFRTKISKIIDVENSVLPQYNEKLDEIEERARRKRLLEKRVASWRQYKETVGNFLHGHKIKIPVNKTDFAREDSPIYVLFRNFFPVYRNIDGYLQITFLNPNRSNGKVNILELRDMDGKILGMEDFDIKSVASAEKLDKLENALRSIDCILVLASPSYITPEKLEERTDKHIENGITAIVKSNDVVNDPFCDMRVLSRDLLAEDYPFDNHITFLEQNTFYQKLFNLVKACYFQGFMNNQLPQEEIVYQVIVETMRDSGIALEFLNQVEDLRLRRILTIICEKLNLQVERYIAVEKKYSQTFVYRKAKSSLKDIIDLGDERLDPSELLATITELEGLVGEVRGKYHRLNVQKQRELRDLAREQLFSNSRLDALRETQG